MYSELINATGISQSTMEGLVLSVLAIIVLGVILILYWPFVIAGAAALFCVVVLANHKVPDIPKPKIVEVVEERPPVVDTRSPPVLEATPKAVEKEPFDEAKAFMQDCLSLTEYSKKQCEKIWSGREDDVDDPTVLKLLDVSNREYKKRRAEALKKPNAVIGHMTL